MMTLQRLFKIIKGTLLVVLLTFCLQFFLDIPILSHYFLEILIIEALIPIVAGLVWVYGWVFHNEEANFTPSMPQKRLRIYKGLLILNTPVFIIIGIIGIVLSEIIQAYYSIIYLVINVWLALGFALFYRLVHREKMRMLEVSDLAEEEKQLRRETAAMQKYYINRICLFIGITLVILAAALLWILSQISG